MAENTADSQNNIYVDIKSLQRLQFKARGFSFSPNQPVNSVLSGKYASKLRGRGLNFEELRHYRPGDDIRSMDWKVTQRTGKPHIKVFTEERERNVYIAIDQRSTMFFGSTGKMKSVIAAEVSALMAWQVVGSGDRVGAVIFNDTEISVIPAKRGQQHIMRLMAQVVKKNQQLKVGKTTENSAQSFNNMLAKLTTISGNNALVILIGDGHGWDDKSTDFIKKIRQHNEMIACHIFDPLEQNLPKMPQMVVSDGLWQIQFSSQNSITQDKYHQEIQQQLLTFDNTARKHRIPLLLIDTVSPVEQQLRKAFGQAPEKRHQ